MQKIYQQIPKIMADVGPIAKNRPGPQGQYKFRGIDDVYESLQLVMAKHGVFSVPEVIEDRSEERTTKNGGVVIYRILKIKYRLFAEDGSLIEATVMGEGMDSGDKASNKAMSAAQKYAFIQIFCIPTKEAKDPEEEGHEVTASKSVDLTVKRDEVPAEAKFDKVADRADLETELKRRNVPQAKWAAIGQWLHGKDRSWISKAIAEAL